MLHWDIDTPVTPPLTITHLSTKSTPVVHKRCNVKTVTAARFKALAKYTIIDARQPELGSWISKHGRRLSCRICCSAGHSVTLSNKVRLLRRHSNSKRHLASLDTICHIKHPALIGVPSIASFKEVLAARRKGLPFLGSTPHIGHRHKIVRMSWCLSEAYSDLDREFLRRSTSISLHHDARGQLFLVRYSAVDDRMHVRKGVLGVVRNHGTTSDHLVQAMLGILESVCTARQQPPRPSQRQLPPPSTVDTQLFEHIKKTIELLDADAASDEQRAGLVLQGKSRSSAIPGVPLPNLKLVLRDRTHAATRLAF